MEPNDKPVDWVVFVIGIIIAILITFSPMLIFVYGAPMVEWTLMSWEVYMTFMASVGYIIGVGIFFENTRRKD